MKLTITFTCVVVLCSSFFLLSVPYLQAQDDQGNGRPCSLKTLKGSYGTLSTGFVRDFPDPGQNPIVIRSLDTFDGEGHMTEYMQSEARETRGVSRRSTLRPTSHGVYRRECANGAGHCVLRLPLPSKTAGMRVAVYYFAP